MHCTNHINENYVQRLVELIEILTEIHFVHPQTFGADVYFLHTTYRLHF